MSKETVDQTVHARIVRKPEPPYEVSFCFWRNRVLDDGKIIEEQAAPISLSWERILFVPPSGAFVLPETADDWLDLEDDRASLRCEKQSPRTASDVHSLLADAESDTRAIEAEVDEVVADHQACIETQRARLRKVLRALDYPEEVLVSDETDKED